MRINLNVEFKDKDKVRLLGAKWDLARKTWYIENVENIEPFLDWISDKLKKPSKTPINTKKTGKVKKTKKHNQGKSINKKIKALTEPLSFIKHRNLYLNNRYYL